MEGGEKSQKTGVLHLEGWRREREEG